MAQRMQAAEQSPRQVMSVSLPKVLLDRAEDLGVDVSQASERGLALTVEETRERHWIEENRAAMESWNDYVAKHGLPLAKYRQF